MKAPLILTCILLLPHLSVYAQNPIHVWEKVEIELSAENSYSNPYQDVEVWIQLKGPGFNKRCYGFWDGGTTWRIRIMAAQAGTWSWTSASNQNDPGLNNQTGSFEAVTWTEAEKQANPLRRGMIRSTANGHAFEYADGTPMFWLADTWWACMTQRYFWHEDDKPRSVGTSEAGFKDYVRLRKAQKFNGCMVIAAFPNWTDQKSGWGGGQWEDEAGNRAFLGPAGIPDLNQLNPAYFQNMDKKVDYLNANGFIPFIETTRRDIAGYWKTEFGWPQSYARYIRYLCFRFQGNIIINSPIHLDAMALTGDEWNQAANIIIDDYGWPPFGHPASANPPGSTLSAFGHTDQARWLTFHSIGNRRDHRIFPELTKMFRLDNPAPCLNNEPYYDGLKRGSDATLGSNEAAYNCRVALYGSVLSGALAGHVYGADHIWDGDKNMPEAFLIQSGAQMQHIYSFLFSEGKAYQNLIPARELLKPNQTENEDNNQGWAYCMKSAAKDFFLLYFEKACAQATLCGTLPGHNYQIQWFKPATGKWLKPQTLRSNPAGKIILPDFPGGSNSSKSDWAMKLTIIR
jgi:hypothetical protein